MIASRSARWRAASASASSALRWSSRALATRASEVPPLVRREAAKVPNLSRGFTLQAWVAMAAYPWNWTPIVAQRDGETRGYSFGIDSTGHFGLQLAPDFRIMYHFPEIIFHFPGGTRHQVILAGVEQVFSILPRAAE